MRKLPSSSTPDGHVERFGFDRRTALFAWLPPDGLGVWVLKVLGLRLRPGVRRPNTTTFNRRSPLWPVNRGRFPGIPEPVLVRSRPISSGPAGQPGRPDRLGDVDAERTIPAHRRASLVRLTPRGRAALRTIRAGQRAWADALGAELGEAELQQAGAVLDRVLQAVRKPELAPWAGEGQEG